MAEFDPAAYIKAATAQQSSQSESFDPVAYLKSQGVDVSPPPEESTAKKLTREFINQGVPVAGAIGAGLLAAPESAGLAAIPAGAAGYAAGKQLARILNHYVLGDDIGSSDAVGLAKQTGKDLMDGSTFEAGGQVLSELPGMIKSGANATKNYVAGKIGANAEYTPIPDKEKILAAAEKLGVSVPKAVLTDNKGFQDFESGLSQSGSIPAKPIREKYNDFFSGLDKASSKISDLKTPDSDFAIGSSIQKDLGDKVNEARQPVSELYKDITPDLQKIPVDKGAVNRTIGQLKKQPIFQTKDGAEFLNEHKDILLDTPELASLKELRSSYDGLTNQNSLPVENQRVKALRDAATKIRDASIAAMKTDLPPSMHGEVDNLAGRVALADASHASNLEDINSIKSIVGNKDVESPVTFLNKLGDAKESDLAQKAANLDVTSFRNLQQKFPTVFEKAKTAKVNDLIQSATSPVKGFDPGRFFKQYDGLDNEMKDILFTPEIQSHIEALRTVKQSIPDQLGPSGTPKGQMIMDAFSPSRNIKDLLIKKSLEAASSPAADEAVTATAGVGNQSKVAPILELLKNRGNAPMQTPVQLPRAANKGDTMEAKAPTKGPDKWVNDGIRKLQDHDPDADTDALNSLKDSKKGRDLLIQASDLKPGSKAMENILSKIKSQQAKDGA